MIVYIHIRKYIRYISKLYGDLQRLLRYAEYIGIYWHFQRQQLVRSPDRSTEGLFGYFSPTAVAEEMLPI